MLFDSPAGLAPESVLNWLYLCSAGIGREQDEAIRQLGAGLPLPAALSDELGLGASPVEIADHFDACRRELELAALLTIVAAVEARVRMDALSRIDRHGDDLAKRLKVLRDNARIDWSIALYDDGIIEAWKTYVGTLTVVPDTDRARLLGAIGRFKNLLAIRHWVAHGRYWKLQRGVEHFRPNDVADIVTDLFDAFRKIAVFGGLTVFA
jgi:hypothetical protein